MPFKKKGGGVIYVIYHMLTTILKTETTLYDQILSQNGAQAVWFTSGNDICVYRAALIKACYILFCAPYCNIHKQKVRNEKKTVQRVITEAQLAYWFWLLWSRQAWGFSSYRLSFLSVVSLSFSGDVVGWCSLPAPPAGGVYLSRAFSPHLFYINSLAHGIMAGWCCFSPP